MAAITVPDLGLDPGRVPDLADGPTRKRLSPAATVAFLRIVDKWHLNNEDAMALLGGVSNGKFYQLKRSPKAPLSQDQLTRVSLLIGIFKSLNILFNVKLANQWISRPNSNPMFNNAPPLQLLIRGGVPGMLEVRRLLDARRGGR